LSSNITFYGGVHEIGGNKFLLEDRGTKIFLDFGMQMSKVNQYFREFVNPRTLTSSLLSGVKVGILLTKNM
jgi:ribonuclease J